MAKLPDISVRQPQPQDIVDDPVGVCGIGTGFEGVISARVRDAHGTVLVETSFMAGGMGVLGNFHVDLALPAIPTTPQGTLEVFQASESGDGSEFNKVTVPIVFGRALIDPYYGFAQYTVKRGDTLRSIAHTVYGAELQWRRIYNANRDRISDPDRIRTGQVLRLPQ